MSAIAFYLLKAVLADRFARNVSLLLLLLLATVVGGTIVAAIKLYRYSVFLFLIAGAATLSLHRLWKYKTKSSLLKKLKARFPGEYFCQTGEFVDLLLRERDLTFAGGTGTFAVYECNNEQRKGGRRPPAAIDFLRNRVAEVVQMNPWMNGRLRTNPNTMAVSLWVPPTEAFSPGGFLDPVELRVVEVETEQELFRLTPSQKDEFLVDSRGMKHGEEVDNPTIVLFKFTFLWTKASNKFAIIFSMSHQIADGSTRNVIWEMLGVKGVVRTLKYHREHEKWNFPVFLPDAALSRFFWMVVSSSLGPMQQVFGGLARRLLPQGGPNSSNAAPYFKNIPEADRDKIVVEFYRIKPEWIAEQKARVASRKRAEEEQEEEEKNDGKTNTTKAGGNAVIVSTNDLLLSWFASQQRHRLAACTTTLNMRGVVEGITREHVGNYIIALVLFPDHFRDPLALRRVIGSKGKLDICTTANNKKKDSDDDNNNDKLCGPEPPSIAGRRIGLTSNQVKNFTDISLPGCDDDGDGGCLLQFPITMVHPVDPAKTPMLIVFQMNKNGDLGLMTATHGGLSDKSPCGEKIPYTDGFSENLNIFNTLF